MKPDLISRIFQIREQYQFQDLALEIFKYQFDNNPVYNSFARQLGIERNSVSSVTDIPFIPVEFFKSHKLISGSHKSGIIFESSGTDGMNVSRHFVADPALYEESLMQSFRMFYGEPSGYFIASMTPSPEERNHSSLAYMMDKLIRRSSYHYSGFYMNNAGGLINRINESRSKDLKVILTGLSYALIDLAEEYSPDLSGVVVMETGGMKGRRKEMTREELHEYLKRKFNLAVIHSEYGMTELLSQAYSTGEGIFHCPHWMRVFIRDYQDPLTLIPETGRTGAINIIDLANVYSCSFIATDDLGRLREDDGFEVLGRIDKSDIRGCNLLTG
ncbi:MAG: acyl transferase [Bacteroidales bacterium]|nr:acyl transferase [Bacteroidales bacterium]